MKRIGIFLCSSLLMSSCASIFCGSKAKVTFDSDISRKATLTIDGQKAQTRHISLYDENSARFRRNDCKGRGSRFYGRTGYCQQEFQCSVRTQSARRPRVGHRCCHRCHYQARIQVLSNRFSAGRERKRLILKENNDYNSLYRL